MARKPLTDRQRRLREAQAELNTQQQLLKQQRQRVAVARRVVEALSCCDWCGARTMATGLELQLCFSCQRDRAELNRLQLLARHGYGPDGKRIGAA